MTLEYENLSTLEQPTVDRLSKTERPNLPIVNIQLNSTHDMSPVPCRLCNTLTCNIEVSHEFWGKFAIFSANKMLGYQCKECKLETTNIEDLSEFLTIVLENTTSQGDAVSSRQLRNELDGLRQVQENDKKFRMR